MSLKILAVDDDPEVLKVIKSIVEPLGCEILTLVGGTEAARRVQREKFDGVFVDAHMPETDGFEVTRQVRQSALNSGIPVVMVTGQDDIETMRRGFKAGATAFLAKPLSRERLYNLIKALRGPMLREKRRQARLPLRTPVKCVIGPGASDCTISASEVISESGMLLGSSGGLEAGREIVLEFRLPTSAHTLKVKGKLLRREPPDRIAVEFTSLSDADREAIQKYIAGTVTL